MIGDDGKPVKSYTPFHEKELHVHPEGTPGDGHTTSGPAITFHAPVPTAGQYRLFLDFKVADSVHTAELTVVVPPAPK